MECVKRELQVVNVQGAGLQRLCGDVDDCSRDGTQGGAAPGVQFRAQSTEYLYKEWGKKKQNRG